MNEETRSNQIGRHTFPGVGLRLVPLVAEWLSVPGGGNGRALVKKESSDACFTGTDEEETGEAVEATAGDVATTTEEVEAKETKAEKGDAELSMRDVVRGRVKVGSFGESTTE